MNTRSTARNSDDILPIWNRLRSSGTLMPGSALVSLAPPEPKTNGTRCIFVEGTAGEGKTTALSALADLGHPTTTEDFLGICNAWDHYDSGSIIHNIVFLHHQLNLVPRSAIPCSAEAYALPHGQLHFFDRSPFSAAIYSNDPFMKRFMIKTMDEITAVHDCIKVLLTAPAAVVADRIFTRYVSSSDNDRLLRHALGERNHDFQVQVAHRYQELASEGHFDWIITATDLTDTLQALLCVAGGPPSMITGLPSSPAQRQRIRRLLAPAAP